MNKISTLKDQRAAGPRDLGRPRTSPDRTEANFEAFQSVLKCKWMLSILDRISGGVRRPGALQRAVPELSKKVMYERLWRLEELGIVERIEVSVKPAEVHYVLTDYGRRFSSVLDDLRAI